MSKKSKGAIFWSKNLFFIFLVPIFFCLFAFYGIENVKALPSLPITYGWVNLGVCTDTNSSNNVLLSDPFRPIIRWTPSGDGQSQYELVVDGTYDTGIVGGSDTSFPLSLGQINFDVPNHSYNIAISGPRGQHGWTPWARGAFTIPHIPGTCVNNLEFCAGTVITPSPSLCTAGYPVVNNGGNSSGGIWSWSCNGIGGGGDRSCSAGTKPPVTGCVTITPPCTNVATLPTSGLCKSTSQLMAGPSRSGDFWNWSCKDTACGTTIACPSLEVLPKIVPSCGSDNGKAFCGAGEKPGEESNGLCSSGTPSGLPGSVGIYEDWTWTCTGSCPTVSTDCSAKSRGACGWKETN